MSKEKFVDFATVRDLLYEAQDRRGQLTYEQTAALQHAEWAASENRNGYATDSVSFSGPFIHPLDARNGSKTDPQVFEGLRSAILSIDSMSNYPELAAKIAELIPMKPIQVKAVAASRRISMEDSDVEQILTLVRQHVGVE